LSAPANGAAGVASSPTFAWSVVPNAVGYRILVATTPAALITNPTVSTCSTCTIDAATSGNSATSYSPAVALSANTLYYWEVQPLASASGSGAWSNIFSFTTAGGALAAPTLSAPANGATNVSLAPTFSWTAVQGSAGYRILVASNQAALPTNPAVVTCANCSLGTTTTATGLTAGAGTLAGGTTYYWEVQALASAGSGENGPWSGVSSFATIPADFSLAVSPGSVSISPGASGTSTLTLTPVNNFSGSPTFTCSVSSGLAGVTCSVGALSTSNAASVTLTAASTAAVYPAIHPNQRLGAWRLACLATLFLLMAAACHRWSDRARQLRWIERWNFRRVALGALLAMFVVAASSCGSSGGSTGTTPTSTAESGTVTVTGSTTSVSHAVTIAVSVT
jgi:hypothetical protein